MNPIFCIVLSTLVLAGTLAATRASETMSVPNGYRVDTIPIPDSITMGVGGLAFTPSGSLLISTREGQVWRYHDGEFSLFADGLHEALGLYVDPQSGDVWVMQRPELTKLIDENHDGRVDFYKTVNAEWGLSDSYHEYTFGPVRDSKGNFYGTLNTSLSWRGWAGSFKWDIGRVHDGKMGRAAKYRGWCFQITSSGQFIPFACGMRSPAGLAINKKDELFYTDNQGDWNGSSTLQHVAKGRFHGHPSSLMDHPEFTGKDLNAIPVEEYEKMRHPPAVFFIHGDLANSPGEPVFNETGGKFGPFENQVFVGDQTKSVLMRIFLEKVNGEYQGCVFPFIGPMQSGIVRNRFGPDGSLWIGQTGRGWRSVGDKIFGLQRVTWNQKTVPLEMQSIQVKKNGFRITFTQAVDAEIALEPERYKVRQWHYLYRPEYGSPKVDERSVDVQSVQLSRDGLHADLTIKLVPGKIYEFQLQGITSANGSETTNRIGWYTLNRLK